MRVVGVAPHSELAHQQWRDGLHRGEDDTDGPLASGVVLEGPTAVGTGERDSQGSGDDVVDCGTASAAITAASGSCRAHSVRRTW